MPHGRKITHKTVLCRGVLEVGVGFCVLSWLSFSLSSEFVFLARAAVPVREPAGREKGFPVGAPYSLLHHRFQP